MTLARRLATGNTYAFFVTSRMRTETRASSASVYVSSVIEFNSHCESATITQRHAVLKHNGLAPLMHVCLAQYGVMAKTCQQ